MAGRGPQLERKRTECGAPHPVSPWGAGIDRHAQPVTRHRDAGIGGGGGLCALQSPGLLRVAGLQPSTCEWSSRPPVRASPGVRSRCTNTCEERPHAGCVLSDLAAPVHRQSNSISRCPSLVLPDESRRRERRWRKEKEIDKADGLSSQKKVSVDPSFVKVRFRPW